MTYGTSHFTSFAKAVEYYESYKIKITKNKVKTIAGVKTYPEVGAREEDANG